MSKHDLLTPMENAEIELPSADTTARCSLDQLIRSLGYTIKHRRNNEQPIWEKNGITFAQDDIVRGFATHSRLVTN